MPHRMTGVCLVSPDVLRLAEFYKGALGVEIEGDDRHAVVKIEGGSLSIFSDSGMEEMAPGSTANTGAGRCILGVEVDDVDVAHADMRRLGATVVMVPTTHPWGRRSAWYHDSDGNT